MFKASADAFADELALIHWNGEARESYFAGMALR